MGWVGNIQVGVVCRLLSEVSPEREEGVSDPFQNVGSIDIKVGFVSAHRERLHPPGRLRLAGAT